MLVAIGLLARCEASKVECTNHSLDRILDLSNSKFQDDADALLIFVILVLDMFQQLSCFDFVFTLLKTGVAINLAVLVNHSQADNLIPILYELIDQPLQSEFGVIIRVCSTEKSARAGSVGVVFVL